MKEILNFASLNFLAFVSVTILLYFLFPLKKQKWVVLLVSSYTFYLLAGYKYAYFIVFTTITTYLTALWLDRISKNSKAKIKQNKAQWSREEKKKYKSSIKIKKRLVMAGIFEVL